MQPSRLFFDASILNNHFAIVYLAIFHYFRSLCLLSSIFDTSTSLIVFLLESVYWIRIIVPFVRSDTDPSDESADPSFIVTILTVVSSDTVNVCVSPVLLKPPLPLSSFP